MQVSKKKMPYGYAVGYIVDGKTAGKGNAHGPFRGRNRTKYSFSSTVPTIKRSNTFCQSRP